MKKILCFLFVLFAASAGAAEFEEGKHYLELPFAVPPDTGKQVEVREFFWYGCPHCYTFEPLLDRWVKTKPKAALFVRTPWTASGRLLHAQAYFAFKEMGLLPRLHGPFFDAVQNPQSALDNEDAIAGFVAAHGGDAGKFRAALRSFSVQHELEQAKYLNGAYDVNSVPMLVIDGRYVTSPALAGGQSQALALVNQLVQKAAVARKRAAK